MRVRLADRALADLQRISVAHAQYSITGAQLVAERIQRTIVLLEKFPLAGHAGRVPGTREIRVSRTPYLVVHVVADNVLWISRIIHGAQQWPRTGDSDE